MTAGCCSAATMEQGTDRGVPFYADDGAFQGYIGSCIDVTERILAQRAPEEGQERELMKLRGLLRICSACRKIHNPAGEWAGDNN